MDSTNKSFGNEKNKSTLKEKVREVLHSAGDNIEKSGQKLEQKGHGKAGRALKNLGDKIEHLGE